MLPARERLRRARDFKRVYAAKRAVVHPLMVLYTRPTVSGRRIGFSVSKKIGGSVKRNRVKRRLREACLEAGPVLKDGFDAILVARSRLTKASYPEIVSTVRDLFRRAGLAKRDRSGALSEARVDGMVDQLVPGSGAMEPQASHCANPALSTD
jgi:ribonuclease P protein component